MATESPSSMYSYHTCALVCFLPVMLSMRKKLLRYRRVQDLCTSTNGTKATTSEIPVPIWPLHATAAKRMNKFFFCLKSFHFTETSISSLTGSTETALHSTREKTGPFQLSSQLQPVHNGVSTHTHTHTHTHAHTACVDFKAQPYYEVCFLFDRSDEFTGDRKNVDWCHFEYLFFTWSLSFEGSLWSQSMIMTPCLWEEKVMRTLKMTTELCATLPWHFPWLTMLAWLLHELKLCLIMLNCTFSCMLIFTTLLRK